MERDHGDPQPGLVLDLTAQDTGLYQISWLIQSLAVAKLVRDLCSVHGV